MSRRLVPPLLLCLWPSLALGQTQSATTTGTALYKQASPAVVTVESHDSKGKGWVGSGFLVSPEGAILTNYHVIAHSKQATVRLANGDAYDTVEVLDIDKRKDIALIKIKAVGLPSLKLGRSNTVEVGDTVFSLSNPLGMLQNTLSQGIVSGIRQGDGYSYFQVSAPISHGSSGGPVFDAKGEVVAIAAGFFEGGQNLNYAIPIDYTRVMLSATEARPLASIYEPEPDSGVSAAVPSKEACRGEQAAREALSLGRSQGYPDDQILEAYAEDPCRTLSYLRQEAQQKAQPSLWTSMTTGNDLKIRVDRDYIYIDRINWPAELRETEAFVRSELKKSGDRWIGKTRMRTPCNHDGRLRWCSLELDIEITSLTNSRIEGRAPADVTFDCGTCQTKKLEWKPFVWIPKD